MNNNNYLLSSKIIKINQEISHGFLNKKGLKRIINARIYNFGILYIMIILIIIFGFIFIFFFSSKNLIKKKNSKKIIENLDLGNVKKVYDYYLQYDEFDELIRKQYYVLQNHFCDKIDKNLNQDYESKITTAKVDFNGKKFDMFVYNIKDIVSASISKIHYWEAELTRNILKALKYYANKNHLEKQNIYLLDIGSNVGWYTYYLGKYGYKILSFEASKINNYILYKNYCLNKDVNITLINKGLDTDDKKCILKTVDYNRGDGMIFCKNRDKNHKDFNGDVYDNIELTKLRKYIKFLSKNNLALMKLDIEGAEGIAIEGGKELITKYHVPFIMLEFEVKMLETHGTNALKFLQFFEKNGYKISGIDFFDKQYLSPLEIIKCGKKYTDLFIIYDKIFG